MGETVEPRGVYQAISRVQLELSKVGIAKSREASAGGKYYFRGIDDIYNAVASILPAHGLVIIPRVLSRTVEERRSAADKSLYNVVVEVEYDLVSVKDGSVHTARTIGEAMDSGDKATNKAMSAAHKYLAIQVFTIPTEGDNDADANNHGGLDADQAEAFIERIKAATDADGLAKAWKEAVAACNAAADKSTYASLKKLVIERGTALKSAA